MAALATLNRRLFMLALAATLTLLLLHAWHHWFLTDDAFISFRYARNLARGQGLVFNPAGERVEGYTNFLWVVLLAGMDRIGASIEVAAPLLSLLLTVALWGLVALYALRLSPSPEHPWLALVPLLYLASTRSVAVWSTGGLETRLFEVLVLGGLLSLISGLEREGPSADRLLLASGLLFGLAALTRPDGILLGAAAIIAAFALRPSRRLLSAASSFATIVGVHVAGRWLYYGDLLPNTYYAKVAGRTWWDMGAKYFALFALEYAIILWIPLLFAAAQYYRRHAMTHRLILVAAIILPHALYVAAIGGDHFEFRPLDLYFPIVFLVMYDGAKELAAVHRPTLAAAATLLVLAGLANPIPLPGHAHLLREANASFVALRAEEHAAFLATVVPEGKALGRLLAEGILPADTYIAIDCVGAIPYYSDLRVLDRLGLTDRQVAREAIPGERLMAHDRRASFDMARRRGADLWAADFVHLLWDPADPRFAELVTLANREGADVWAAATGDGGYLLASLPQGISDASRRFPRLRFLSLADPKVADSLKREAEHLAAPR